MSPRLNRSDQPGTFDAPPTVPSMTTPGVPMPTAPTSPMATPASSQAASTPASITSITPRWSPDSGVFILDEPSCSPSSPTTSVEVLVPPRSTPMVRMVGDSLSCRGPVEAGR